MKPRSQPRCRITAEAVAAYQTAMAGRDLYVRCIRGRTTCRSENPGREHCDGCREHVEASRRLNQLLGVQLWETSPLDADTPEPPGYPCHRWARARELRAELELAIKESASDPDRHHPVG